MQYTKEETEIIASYESLARQSDQVCESLMNPFRTETELYQDELAMERISEALDCISEDYFRIAGREGGQ